MIRRSLTGRKVTVKVRIKSQNVKIYMGDLPKFLRKQPPRNSARESTKPGQKFLEY